MSTEASGHESVAVPRVRRAATFLGAAVTAGLILAVGLYGGWLVGRKGAGAAPAAHGAHEEPPGRPTQPPGPPAGPGAHPRKRGVALPGGGRRPGGPRGAARAGAGGPGPGEEEAGGGGGGGPGASDPPPARRILGRNRLWSAE